MKILKNKWLWLVIIIVVVGVAFYMTSSGDVQTVQIYQVEKDSVDKFVEDVAVVKSDDDKLYYAELNGTLKDVVVEVGDSVTSGMVLATFDSDELQYQLEELEARKQGLQAGKAEVADPDNGGLIRQLSSVVSKARSNVANVNRQLNNQRALYQTGAASLESVKQLEAMLAAANSDLAAAHAGLSQAQQGGSDNLVDQANSQVAAIDVQIDRLKNQLAKSQVIAEADGVVVSKYIDNGQFVPIGTPLLSVEDPNKIMLEAMLLAEDVVDLTVDSMVEVLHEKNVIATGKVRQIYPKAESSISDLGVEQKRVKVIVNIDDTALKLGYEYDVKVYIKRENSIRIPDSAYFELDGVGKVFVVEADQLQLKDVEVTFKGNDYYAVKGLQAGEKVVKSPASELEVGMKVAVE